jgi:hypothetical protein
MDYTCTSGNYFAGSYYPHIRNHEQPEPPTWERYRSLFSAHQHFTDSLKYGYVEQSWERRAWYKEQQTYRERLDRLALQILTKPIER